MQIVSMKATMRTGTARRSTGSAVNRRRYAGLAIDCAKPLIESDRKDALAISARAMPASAWMIPRPASKRCAASLPNHCHLNRRESICRESEDSRVNIFLTSIPGYFAAEEVRDDASIIGKSFAESHLRGCREAFCR